MKDSNQNHVLPAVGIAGGVIALSTALYATGLGTGSSLPWFTVPFLALLIYSGSLMLWGKLESPRQWLVGLGVMLGVHVTLGIVMGIIFFFARPSAGLGQSLSMALIGYGPAVVSQLLATVAICYWVPRLLSAAQAPEPIEAPRHYASSELSPSIQAAMHLRAEMMERVSVVSKQVVQEELPEEKEEPKVAEKVLEEALHSNLPAEEPSFSLESSGRRYRVVGGKLVEDSEAAEPATGMGLPSSEEEERIPRIAREIPWDSPGCDGEPEARLYASMILSQIPENCLRVPEGSQEIWLRFPHRFIAPQLPEGCIWIRADRIVEQLPPEWLQKSAQEIAQEIPDGYLELPLKEIVDQMPWSVFALPHQRPAAALPGAEWGTLFREAA